jgi:aryl-alcohol dehydrogenase-like predicted oxidoreductase
MEYRRLGGTDIMVSRICLGCWGLVGGVNWGPQSEADSLATIRAALDGGVTFFDTAELYGEGASEELVGKALTGRRREVVIASKVKDIHLSAGEIQRACERSLRRLCTDYIDLYQVHYANPTVPLGETVAALEKLREQGKVRAVGVCNFGPLDLADFHSHARCETNQVPYSLIWRAIECDIVGSCASHGVGILAYSPLIQGLLSGRFANADEVPVGRARTRHFSRARPMTRHGEPGCEQETFSTIDRIRAICERIDRPMAEVALAWVLHQAPVIAVVMGGRAPEPVREDLHAASLKLTPQTLAALDAATKDLKEALGQNPDLWQSQSRFH